MSTSFSLGFGFDFGLGIVGKVSKEVSKPVSTSLGECFTRESRFHIRLSLDLVKCGNLFILAPTKQ